jgi:hypothetical protein
MTALAALTIVCEQTICQFKKITKELYIVQAAINNSRKNIYTLSMKIEMLESELFYLHFSNTNMHTECIDIIHYKLSTYNKKLEDEYEKYWKILANQKIINNSIKKMKEEKELLNITIFILKNSNIINYMIRLYN